MKYPILVNLLSYGRRESNQNRSGYLSWIKISKIVLLCALFSVAAAQAKEPPEYPELNPEGEFSLMGTLSDLGLHNLQYERWNAYAQGTYIMSFKEAFSAAYTNLNGSPQFIITHCRAQFYGNIYCLSWT